MEGRATELHEHGPAGSWGARGAEIANRHENQRLGEKSLKFISGEHGFFRRGRPKVAPPEAAPQPKAAALYEKPQETLDKPGTSGF